MGKATRDAVKAMNKIKAKREAEKYSKSEGVRIRGQVSKIKKRSKNDVDRFVPANSEHDSLSKLSISRLIKLEARIKVLMDFFYDNGQTPDKNVEVELLMRHPHGHKTVEMVLFYEIEDQGRTIYKGGLNPEKPHK